ncbi:helix-turn-helix transcriptional regulator [Methylosinus sp. H3A]|uniref:helix-turn-helix transcriptional regulator n=1 Tax=Methylosinus sp. H3A TaxID=2785786 RepID=UPI0018C33552|nr:helix-turn-helix transcriptional regulator [Methylosinus sp. H3A]MBG0808378.1 helix-turn-helix transcriptional regulator [Methylosinus sp. H3A]
MSKFEALADRIYEAAVVPEFWPEVLDAISTLSGSVGGILFATNAQFSGWTASPRMAPMFAEFVERGWAARNPRPARGRAFNAAGFVSDHELFSPEEMDADPTYAYLRSQGLGWCAGKIAIPPTGDTLIFSWEKRFADGPFDRAMLDSLDAIGGHLARAALIAARLGLERARAAAETMRALGLPAAVLSRSHRLLLANDLFARFVPSLVQDRRERAIITDMRVDALFAQALARLRIVGAPAGLQSLPVPAREGNRPLVLHLAPIRGAAQDVFAAGDILLIVTELTIGATPDAALLQGLFDLTPAEARVARAIAAGRPASEIAGAHGVSAETVRTQLRAVFAKTGVSRQVDLVRLLSGATLP